MNSRTTISTRSTTTTTLNNNLDNSNTISNSGNNGLIKQTNSLNSSKNVNKLNDQTSAQQAGATPLSSTSLSVKEILQREKSKKDFNKQNEDVEMISQSGDEDASLRISSHRHPTTLVIDWPGQKSETSRVTYKVVPIASDSIKATSNNSNNSLANSPIASVILNGNNSTFKATVTKSNALLNTKENKNNSDTETFNDNNNNIIKKMEPFTIMNTPLGGKTTTVNLSESNQNVYFMMQTPIDLITSASASTTPLTLSSTMNTASAHLPISTLLSPEAQTTTVTLTSPLSSSSSSINSSPTPTKVVRDERRRANHNEVERRRRDNINKWIVELSKVIPDCSNDQSKHGQSKGGILEKTVQYLCDMKQVNLRLSEQICNLDKLKQENEILRQQNESFKKENQILKIKLGDTNQEAGSSVAGTGSTAS